MNSSLLVTLQKVSSFINNMFTNWVFLNIESTRYLSMGEAPQYLYELVDKVSAI